MKNTIDLQRPDLLPEDFKSRLYAIETLCREHEFSDELVEETEVSILVDDLNRYCMEHQVIGIHYTRAIKEDIESKGLLVRTGKEIRNDLLDRFGNLFNSKELEFLRNKWKSHQEIQADIRDLRLWFNFTTEALRGSGGSGTKYLLGLYGGEQINMGIEFGSPIGKKLASIGEPMIVRCSLDPNNVDTYIKNPWGKIIVSSFHLQVRPDAYRIDQDGSQRSSVPPENLIVEVVR